MPNRLFWGQAPRALVETPLPNARLRVFANRTTTQIPVTDAAGNVLSQPLESYADGTFDPIYRTTGEPVRVLLTDANDVPLPGYPLDDCLLFSTETTGAAGIPFAPTETIPATTVQDAIEMAAAAASGPADLLARTLTFWTTGGTGDAYTITPSPAISAYAVGQGFYIVPNRANTTVNTTISISGRGATTITKWGRDGYPVNLEGGELQPGQPVLIVYDGQQWVMADPRGANGSTENGFFYKLPSGLMICRSLGVSAAFQSAAQMGGSWTYPSFFTGAPVVSLSLPPSSSWVGITPAQVGVPRYDPGNGVVTFAIPRAQGAPDFESGDAINGVQLTAIGRWY